MNSRLLRIAQLTLLITLVLAWGLAARAPAGADELPPRAPAGETEWQSPPGPELSQGANGADIPVITAAPDAGRLIVVYNRWLGSNTDRDPYYHVSTDGGATWSAGVPIHTSSIDSVQVDVAVDTNNTAHAAWVEAATGNLTLKYAREDQWAANTATTIATSPIFLSNPAIVADGTTLHLVWSQKSPVYSAPDVYHALSTDGGDSWSTPQAVHVEPPGSLAPTLAVDGGTLHLVWEEGQADGTATILYAQGTVAGNTVTWSVPIAVSTVDAVEDAREPTLVSGNGGVHVAFGNKMTLGSGDAAEIRQWVYYTRCFSQCTDAAQWSTPTNVSGQYVNVNTNNPFFLIPAMIFDQGCVYAAFHGVPQGGGNEMVLGVNSCNGWAGGGREQITEPAYQGIFPNLAVSDGTVHLAYARIAGGNPQIHYMSGQLPEHNGVYLPLIRR